MRFGSLRGLAIAFALVFVMITVGTGIAIHRATHAAMAGLVDKRIGGASAAIAPVGAPLKVSALTRRIGELASDRDTADIGVELTDATGRHVTGNVEVVPLPLGYSSLTTENNIPGLREGRALVRLLPDGMHLTTIAETEPVTDYNTARTWIYFYGFGSIVLLVLSALGVLIWTISRRTVAISTTAEAIIDGDMRRRLPDRGSRGEFDRQARILNRMLDRIGDLMAGLANISNDIAHDLRTPLARLRNSLSAIERDAASESIRADAKRAIAQADEILATFTAILRLAEIEGGDRRAGFGLLDLGTLARETGSMMTPVADEAGYRLVVGDCGAAIIEGDRQLIAQAIINLIENAMRHTPAGTRIALSVAGDANRVTLKVADDGPGIPAEQHVHVLRRLGRLDRTRARPGHGLGLPLVDAIARLHGGMLTLQDAGPGLRVVIDLPRRR